MKATLEIPDSELANLVKKASPIQCRGATEQLTKPTVAFVEVVNAPRGGFRGDGESYVLCPRLTEFYDDSRRYACFQGDLKDLQGTDIHSRKELMQDCSACPYYQPKKEER